MRWEERDINADASRAVMRFPYGLYIVRRTPGILRMTLSGEALAYPVFLPVRTGANVFSLPINLSRSLGNLFASPDSYAVSSGPNSSTADLLTFEEPSTSNQRGPFYHSSKPDAAATSREARWWTAATKAGSLSISPRELSLHPYPRVLDNSVRTLLQYPHTNGLQQQVHKSGTALERFLKSFVETYNRTRGPFNWTKGPEKLSKILNRQQILSTKLQAHVAANIMLEPGRSHILGFLRRAISGDEIDEKLYSDQVKDLVNKGVYYKSTLPSLLVHSRKYTVKTEFALREPAFMHGMDNVSGENELAQVFFSPFAWDAVEPFDSASGKRPGKIFTQSLFPSEMTINNASVFQFSLRTTKEGSNGIRPLVDANIRAQWNNPKWDSKLNLPTLAAYSATTLGVGQNALDVKPDKSEIYSLRARRSQIHRQQPSG